MEAFKMSIINFEEKEKTNKVEYPKLRLIQGGKEPPNKSDYWLKDLEENAVFIARIKKTTDRWIASEYHIKIKVGDAFMLRLAQWDPEKGRERDHYSWVVGPDFSNDWDCIEVLNDGKNYPKEEVEDSGKNYRTDNKERLEGDVGISTDNIMDKDTGQEIIHTKSKDE
jgi:hypothetical protein